MKQDSKYLGGRYKVISLLGSGGMGTVFLVRDLATGGEVALKRLKPEFTGSEENLRFLETEFRHLSTFDHPHLVRVYDFHVDAQIGAYFTMEYINGVSIVEYLSPLNVTELYKVAFQVCEALAYVQSQGFVHGDIKPSNILITKNENNEPLVKLLDFGLVRASGIEQAKIWGTCRTIAPEIIRGSAADARSDLYSFGIVLYSVVTGRLPFTDDDPMVVLRHHLTTTPVRASRLNPDLDPDIDRIVTRLLEKNPARRYYSADDLAQVFAEKSGMTTRSSFTFSRLNSSGHVGRWQELSELLDRYRETQRGKGSVGLLIGKTGIGKTRLLKEFKTAVQLSQGNCYMVTCKDMPSLPFATMTHLYAQACGSDQSWNDNLDVSLWKEEWQQEILLNKLMEAWTERTRQSPLVIIAEDLQEADQGTIAFFAYCQPIFNKSNIPLLFIASAREEELPANSPISHFITEEENQPSTASVIRLTGLSQPDHHQLMLEILGSADFPAEFEAHLFQTTGGNPSITIEILNSLVESNVLVRVGQRWVLRGDMQSWSALMDELSTLTIARINSLPMEEQELLRQASILGERFTDELLIEFSELPANVVRSLLLRMVRIGILERHGKTFWFARESSRRAIYEALGVEEKIELHQKALEIFSNIDNEENQLTLSAEHFCSLIELGFCERSNEISKTLLEASELAVKNLMFKNAQKYLNTAGQLIQMKQCDELSSEIIYRTRIARLKLAQLLGDHSIVQEDLAFFDAFSETLEPGQRVEIFHLRAGLAINSGRLDEAELWCQKARRLLSTHDDTPLYAEITMQLAEIFKIRGQPRQALGMYENAHNFFQRTNNHVRSVECVANIGKICSWIGEQDKAVEFLLKALEMYTALRDQMGRCRTFNNLGVALNNNSQHQKALEYFKESLAIAQKIGNKRFEGVALLNIGANYLMLDDYESASAYLEDAFDIFRRLDQRVFLTMTFINIGYLKLLLGDFQKARTWLESAIKLADQEGFKRESAIARLYLGGVQFLSGEVEDAFTCFLAALNLQEQIEDMLGAAEVHNWLSRVYRHPQFTNLAQSLEHAERAYELAKQFGDPGGEAHALANKAATYLAKEDMQAALQISEEAVKAVENKSYIEGFKEEIFFIRYRILTQAGFQSEAKQFLQQAMDELHIKADRIRDPEKRIRYLMAVPLHRRIYEAVASRSTPAEETERTEADSKLIWYESENPTEQVPSLKDVEWGTNEIMKMIDDDLPEESE